MQPIGKTVSTVQYRYLANPPPMDKQRIVETGVAERIKSEMQFQEANLPQSRNENIEFRRGKLGECVIQMLRCGNVGVTVKVVGSSQDANTVLDSAISILNEYCPEMNLLTIPKRINHTTDMKVKLEVDPKKFFSAKLLSLMESLAPSMSISEGSKISLNFPTLLAFFYSEPDVQELLKTSESASAEDIAAMLRTQTGTRGITLTAESTRAYRDHEFEFTASCDNSRALDILKQIEDLFGT
jgi:hypothetical protein